MKIKVLDGADKENLGYYYTEEDNPSGCIDCGGKVEDNKYYKYILCEKCLEAARVIPYSEADLSRLKKNLEALKKL